MCSGSKMKFIALTILTLLMLGCDQIAEYEDVSHLPEIKDEVGRQYKYNEPMHLSGVNLPPGYGKEVDVYTISSPNPGWSGPELISRETLSAGQVFTVKSFLKCTNCGASEIFSELEIELLNVSLSSIKKVTMHADYFASQYVSKVE